MRFRIHTLPFLLAVIPARRAWAVQTHSGEGLVAHELGHLFLLAAMGFLAVRSLSRPHPGWRRIGWGAALFALWSAATGAYHLAPEPAPPWVSILSLDHLLLIPALACFWFGLGRMGDRKGG